MYQTINLINGKFYTGVHSTKDLDDGYLGSGKYLKYALNKYGKENFKREILEFFGSKSEMYYIESLIVNEEFVKRKDNYNIRIGGRGGWDHITSMEKQPWKIEHAKQMRIILSNKFKNDKEFVRKFKLKQMGRKHTEKSKEKMKLANVGRKHTEETKKKIGKANSIKQIGLGNSNYGKCWIYNLELKQCKPIKKEELKNYIQEGWIKGRKMKMDGDYSLISKT
jgi:hypothetical protein